MDINDNDLFKISEDNNSSNSGIFDLSNSRTRDIKKSHMKLSKDDISDILGGDNSTLKDFSNL